VGEELLAFTEGAELAAEDEDAEGAWSAASSTAVEELASEPIAPASWDWD